MLFTEFTVQHNIQQKVTEKMISKDGLTSLSCEIVFMMFVFRSRLDRVSW